MGHRIGIAGTVNSGKSRGRRYIPDGENVMLIQPSVKSSHLFIGPKDVASFSNTEIDHAIEKGTRKMVDSFDIVSPVGKYNSLEESYKLLPDPATHNLASVLKNLTDHMTPDKRPEFFPEESKARELFKGNVMLCDNISALSIYTNFINKFMPWIHTIFEPDFTHYISEKITSSEFIAKKLGGDQYTKYLELAADGLRQYIKSSDSLRKNLIVVTEYHATYVPELDIYEVFTPGGKMLTEKLLPSSYYDTFLFTDVKYSDDDEGDIDYRFVTRKIKRYPEARSIGQFPDLFIPNNIQEVLTRVRHYNNIPIIKTK